MDWPDIKMPPINLHNAPKEGKMLVEHNPRKHGELFTGPVDSPREEVAMLACPICNHEWLTFTPSQFGQCHGGFATRVLREHYYCEECCASFVWSER